MRGKAGELWALMEKQKMLAKMIKLLRENHSCVLATCSDNRPHCSLMAYVADESGRLVYMLTQRQSKKYENMQQNPHVSFLVDTRKGKDRSRIAEVRALTVHGTFHALEDAAERDAVLSRVLAAHPHLQELAGYPDAQVFSIKLESFLLLDGVVDAYFELLE